jgi:hypothetical protein
VTAHRPRHEPHLHHAQHQAPRTLQNPLPPLTHPLDTESRSPFHDRHAAGRTQPGTSPDPSPERWPGSQIYPLGIIFLRYLTGYREASLFYFLLLFQNDSCRLKLTEVTKLRLPRNNKTDSMSRLVRFDCLLTDLPSRTITKNRKKRRVLGRQLAERILDPPRRPRRKPQFLHIR